MGREAGRQAGRQAGKQAGRRAGGRAGRQAGKLVALSVCGSQSMRIDRHCGAADDSSSHHKGRKEGKKRGRHEGKQASGYRTSPCASMTSVVPVMVRPAATEAAGSRTVSAVWMSFTLNRRYRSKVVTLRSCQEGV